MNIEQIHTIRAQVKEILQYIDGGPWHWADWDLVLMYMADCGYDTSKEVQPEIVNQLDIQAYCHSVLIPEIDPKPKTVWATRPEITTQKIVEDTKRDLL